MLLSGTQPLIFKIIITQLGMLKHHNYAVKAHYSYSVTEGVFKRKSIFPLDVSVSRCMLVSFTEPEALWTYRDFQ